MNTADDDGLYELHTCHCEACNRVRKVIRLDAMKEGMRRAANQIRNELECCNCEPGTCEVCTAKFNSMTDILTAAEQLTEKDL